MKCIRCSVNIKDKCVYYSCAICDDISLCNKCIDVGELEHDHPFIRLVSKDNITTILKHSESGRYYYPIETNNK